MQQLAQDPDALQLVLGGQQLLAAGAGAVDVDGREHTLFSDAAVQLQLQVTGALEFLVDHLVHLRAGFHQRGGEDGQRAALLDVARGAEETLGLLQSVGVDTTGEHLAGARDHGVVGTRQASDGVEQDDHILLVLDQALGLLDHHLGDLHVAGRRLVKGGGNHFAAHGALHLGHFFRALVDQQDDQVALGIVARDVAGDVLQHDRLARLRRRDDQAALTLADRCAEVDHATGEVFGGAVAGLHLQALVGEQRGQVLEENLVLRVFRPIVVDRVDLEQGEVALAFLRRADLADDGVAGTQVEATDLAGRHIDVVRAGQIGRIRGAQEAETVLENLQHAVTGDFLAAFRVLFQQGENHVLLARTGHVVDAHLFGHFQQFGDGLLLEFSQIHRKRSGRM